MKLKKGIIAVGLLLAGCVTFKPVAINSDPNQERLQRTEERVNRDNIEAFIAQHPEFDDETRKALRDGTLSPAEAMERQKNKPAPTAPPKKTP